LTISRPLHHSQCVIVSYACSHCQSLVTDSLIFHEQASLVTRSWNLIFCVQASSVARRTGSYLLCAAIPGRSQCGSYLLRVRVAARSQFWILSSSYRSHQSLVTQNIIFCAHASLVVYRAGYDLLCIGVTGLSTKMISFLRAGLTGSSLCGSLCSTPMRCQSVVARDLIFYG